MTKGSGKNSETSISSSFLARESDLDKCYSVAKKAKRISCN